MTTSGRGGPPRAKLPDVPRSVRHLWSLLYRATRRHAERVDALSRRVRALALRTTSHRRELDHLWRRVEELERRLVAATGEEFRP